MKKVFFPILLIAASSAWARFETDLSGNLEAQGRHSWNNEMAKENLGQNWDQEDFYLYYGNLNGKVDFRKNSRIESNLFARYSHSDLYRDNSPFPQYAAPLIYTFPNQ